MKRFAVIGLGNFGFYAAKALFEDEQPNMLEFIPLAEEFNLVQVGPPKAFIGKSLKDLNPRAKYNVHVIAIKELVPENFILVLPADFVIKDSDILVMPGKTKDIRNIKA
jgi:trk system potassium uptake protein TrkA